ncbi:MAG: 4-hydroxy-tetrahydrodipicolinate synthase [Halobacteriovoraceae bacterium]|nr:4-hydroxy-tetrahydrodipicolinate synthase [Halobacteriovoraceae bacterium]
MKLDNPLWTAMITPMELSGRVDFESLEQLLILQKKAGNGILLLGSTGESLAFDPGEKKEILSFVLQKDLQIPLMAGIGGIHLPSALRWMEYLEGLDVDCYLLTTPPYCKPGKRGQYHWFKTILEKSGKPCVLYNVPSRSGCSLNFDTVKDLAGHPNFWGVKEASGQVEDFLRYKKSAPDVKILGGDDALFPEFSSYGVDGLVSVAANVWPYATRRYVETAMSKKLQNASEWRDACQSLFTASNPVPVKALMAYKNMIKSNTVSPPLSSEDLHNLDQLISADLWVNKWMEK